MSPGYVPPDRIRVLNDRAIDERGDYVVYWMIANRRTRCNFALQYAVEFARELNRPLVVLEALRVGYRWASDRLHAFVLEGMADNANALAGRTACRAARAADGRGPNGYAGIFWCFGRYDRPWGPERPVFGKGRYMSVRNTLRKLDCRPYLQRFEA